MKCQLLTFMMRDQLITQAAHHRLQALRGKEPRICQAFQGQDNEQMPVIFLKSATVAQNGSALFGITAEIQHQTKYDDVER